MSTSEKVEAPRTVYIGYIPTENGVNALLSRTSSGREYHLSGMKSAACSKAHSTTQRISKAINRRKHTYASG